MKLPHAEQATVPEQKVVDYLLSVTHRDGRHKAAYFGRFGFTATAWQVFAEALRRHAADYKVVETDQTAYGTSYVIEGPLMAPDGRMPVVRVVWFVETGQTSPRLVTAYPSKGAIP
jgi:hypothetical protein